MQRIKTYLWFDDQAEEAANFYVSLFNDAKILDIKYSGKAGPGEEGTVLLVTFQLEGLEFIALNGGPQFKFTEAISLCVDCNTQAEVDELWEKLAADGGEHGPCGWLKDKYGLSWQIVPRVMLEYLSDPDETKSARAMAAMLQMSKLDIDELRAAYEGS
ncbi:MAG: VOC family protein [Streptosporangiales bacterium]|nr:VOC family protein [Streptosporangiales bacterium]